PADIERLAELLRDAPDLLEELLVQGVRREGRARVAGMDARLLDVLHDRRDDDLLAVRDRIDVDLDRLLEILVDEDGETRLEIDRVLHVVLELRVVPADLHGAAAENVGGTHEHRIADLAGDASNLRHVERDAVRRLDELQAMEQPLEAVAVLG